jgi:hypothetical protein
VERESLVRSENISKDRYLPAPPEAAPCHAAAAALTALSIEFVAKPAEARRAQMAIPEAVNSTLKGVAGYAGCLVMASDQEARLITLITFWIGEDRSKNCSRNQRWLVKLIVPYLEACLRLRTFTAHRREILELGDQGETSSVHAALPSYAAATEPNARFAA